MGWLLGSAMLWFAGFALLMPVAAVGDPRRQRRPGGRAGHWRHDGLHRPGPAVHAPGAPRPGVAVDARARRRIARPARAGPPRNRHALACHRARRAARTRVRHRHGVRSDRGRLLQGARPPRPGSPCPRAGDCRASVHPRPGRALARRTGRVRAGLPARRPPGARHTAGLADRTSGGRQRSCPGRRLRGWHSGRAPARAGRADRGPGRDHRGRRGHPHLHLAHTGEPGPGFGGLLAFTGTAAVSRRGAARSPTVRATRR